MKDTSMMDSRLRLLEQLYDRDDGSDATARIQALHSEHHEEIESIQSMKSALDARPRRRPAPATIDAVLQAASDASKGRAPVRPQPRGRTDRRPRPRRAVYLRSAGAATAVLTVLLLVTAVWQADLIEPVLPEGSNGAVAGETKDASVSTDAPSPADAASDASDTASEGEDDYGQHLGAPDYQAALSQVSRAGAGGSDALPAPHRVEGPRAAGERFSASPSLALHADPRPSKTQDSRAQSTYAERLTGHQFPPDGRLDGSDGDGLRRAGAGTRVIAPRNRNAARDVADRLPVEFDLAAGGDAFWPNRFNPTRGRRPSDILPNGMRATTTFIVTDGAPTAEELAWDQSDMVMDMYQQIRLIENGVAGGWEPPSIPLEMALTVEQPGDPSIRPAGDHRP